MLEIHSLPVACWPARLLCFDLLVRLVMFSSSCWLLLILFFFSLLSVSSLN